MDILSIAQQLSCSNIQLNNKYNQLQNANAQLQSKCDDIESNGASLRRQYNQIIAPSLIKQLVRSSHTIIIETKKFIPS